MSGLTVGKTYARKNTKKRRKPFPKDLVKQYSKSNEFTTLFDALFMESIKQRNLTAGKDESSKENVLPYKNKHKQQRKFARKKDQLPSVLEDSLESCDAEAESTFDELLKGPCYRPANFKPGDKYNANDTIEVNESYNEFEDTLFASPKLKNKGMKYAKVGRKPQKADTAAACIGAVPKSRGPDTVHDPTAPKFRETDTVYVVTAPTFQEPVAVGTNNVPKSHELGTIHTNTTLDPLQADNPVSNDLLIGIGTPSKTHQANTLSVSQRPTTAGINDLSLRLNRMGFSPAKSQLMISSTPNKLKFEYTRFSEMLDVSPISHNNDVSTKIVYSSPIQQPRCVLSTYLCDVRHSEVQVVEECLFKKPVCLTLESKNMSCKKKSPLHVHNDKLICNEGSDNKSIHMTSVQPIHVKESLKCSATHDAVSVVNGNLCMTPENEAECSEPDTILRKCMPGKLGVVVRRHLLDFDSSLDMFSSYEEENNLSNPEDANTIRTDISGNNESEITELKINSPISKRSVNISETTHQISTSSEEISVIPTGYNYENSELDDSNWPFVVLKNNLETKQTVSVHLPLPVLASNGNLSKKCSQDTQINRSHLENSHVNVITSPVTSLPTTFNVHHAQISSFENEVQNSDCAIIIPVNKWKSNESTNDTPQIIVKDPSHSTLLPPKNDTDCSIMKLGAKLYSSKCDSEGQQTVVNISHCCSSFTSLHDNMSLIEVANKLEFHESENETPTIIEDCTYSVVVSPRYERDTSNIIGDNDSLIENNLRHESTSVIMESDLPQVGDCSSDTGCTRKNSKLLSNTACNESCNSDKAADKEVFHTTTLQKGTLCCKDTSVQDILRLRSEKSQCVIQEKGSWIGSCQSNRASSILSNSRLHYRHSHHNVIILSTPVRPSLGFQDVFTRNSSILHKPEVSSTLRYSSTSAAEPETEPLWTARDEVLVRCDQIEPMPFLEAMPEDYFLNCKKIGEGVYGEVFSCMKPNGDRTVLKIIPIEGSELVNGEVQKSFENILSEVVIAMELSNLGKGTYFCTDGFAKMERCWCLQGKYPPRLLELWHEFDNTKGSENDCPIMFLDDQLYIVLELVDGGTDLEAYVFNSAEQSLSVFQQVAYTLAVAECALEFEHRDLHWGNILIAPTLDRTKTFVLYGEQHTIPTKGVQVAIIDFTLSRMTYDGCCIFNDLSQDPTLFQSEGDYQFEVYRLMQIHNNDHWELFAPFTNVIWLHYVLDKMIHGAHYRRKTTKVHQKSIEKLEQLKRSILDAKGSAEFVLTHTR